MISRSQGLTVLGVAAILGTVVVGAYWDDLAYEDRDHVTIDGSLDAAGACPSGKPLHLTVTNKSRSTIRSVDFEASVYERGNSAPVASQRSMLWTFIVRPGNLGTGCFPLDWDHAARGDLAVRVALRSVSFYRKDEVIPP